VVVGQQPNIDAPFSIFELEGLTKTIAEGVNTRPVANAVIEQLNLPMTSENLLSHLSAEQVNASQFVQISYTDSDPQRAQQVVNAVAEVLSRQISEKASISGGVTVSVWETAVVPDAPVSPNLLRIALVALIAGLMLGVSLAFVMEYLDDSWRSSEEAEQVSGVPTLGVIPEIRVTKQRQERVEDVRPPSEDNSSEDESRRMRRGIAADDLSRRLVTVIEPNGVAAEAFRRLRTNLLYSFVDDPPRVIVLTSPGAAEGKSTACANLSVVLAQAGTSVLAVDCDLRAPALHKFFGLRNIRGIMDVLAGEYGLEEVCTEVFPGLKVISAGPVPPKPADVLGTKRFTDFLDRARREFDYVMLDASPVGLVSDPAILAAMADGVLLVLDAQNTRKGSVRQSTRSLAALGANVLGTVMTDVIVSKGDYRYLPSYNHAYE
jgi:capsular exopolysaccharide synthesis family protein